ncbi:RsmB/NOP family class I SAM-dependent RNA methyltransferase [Deinococcus fonticola]|uniref:RsmB/NOP family class I SAM-dependent RNA methyltransferase n=1 Tax=Deinococcus fonticola TaxID=2528713 RepID=UPI001074B011|nr:transcription antitermination factor NusB [Deinococcus fonticola]
MSRPDRRPDPSNPAREVAVRVLYRVLEGEAFAAPALDRALREARLPARDAGLATHIVYGTLRHYPSLMAALSPLLTGETQRKTWAVLLAGTFEKLFLHTPTHAVVNEYVNLTRSARLGPSGLVNAVLRRVEAVSAPSHELPEWLANVYAELFGQQAAQVTASLLQPQPLWLSLSEEGAKLIEEDGGKILRSLDEVDEVELPGSLRDSPAFTRGHAQPMNPASLACVHALGDVQGQRVLDLAGGAGVKAAMLAARGADVTSVDLLSRKHEAARANLKRLGLQAQFVTHDLRRPLDVPKSNFVLLDAPCTGSGTLRSHPEIKLRLTPQDVTELSELQGRMLPNAADLVEPGGVLVYSVCSVTPQEGPEVVQNFVNVHPEFMPEELPPLDIPVLREGPGIMTVPLDGVDGFYIARLRRKS